MTINKMYEELEKAGHVQSFSKEQLDAKILKSVYEKTTFGHKFGGKGPGIMEMLHDYPLTSDSGDLNSIHGQMSDLKKKIENVAARDIFLTKSSQKEKEMYEDKFETLKLIYVYKVIEAKKKDDRVKALAELKAKEARVLSIMNDKNNQAMLNKDFSALQEDLAKIQEEIAKNS